MIQPNEIRRGNYILYPHGEDWVECINYDRDEKLMPIVIDGFSLDELNPIPLTPEILEKCGFEKEDDPDYYTLKGWGFWISYRYNKFGSRLITDRGPELLHLHQLQNLVFATTGQELEYKL